MPDGCVAGRYATLLYLERNFFLRVFESARVAGAGLSQLSVAATRSPPRPALDSLSRACTMRRMQDTPAHESLAPATRTIPPPLGGAVGSRVAPKPGRAAMVEAVACLARVDELLCAPDQRHADLPRPVLMALYLGAWARARQEDARIETGSGVVVRGDQVVVGPVSLRDLAAAARAAGKALDAPSWLASGMGVAVLEAWLGECAAQTTADLRAWGCSLKFDLGQPGETPRRKPMVVMVIGVKREGGA